MEALAIRDGRGGPPKPENYIARNKNLIKEISRKHRVRNTIAKPVSQQGKTSRPCAAAQQRRHKDASHHRETEDSVLVSKQYLEELLRFKVHNSVALSARPDPTPSTVAVPSSTARVEVDSIREQAQAVGEPTHFAGKGASSSEVVKYNATDIPGLGGHEVCSLCVRVPSL